MDAPTSAKASDISTKSCSFRIQVDLGSHVACVEDKEHSGGIEMPFAIYDFGLDGLQGALACKVLTLGLPRLTCNMNRNQQDGAKKVTFYGAPLAISADGVWARLAKLCCQ